MRKGKTVYHCNGSSKGKKIRTDSSVRKAKKAHVAMAINRRKRKR